MEWIEATLGHILSYPSGFILFYRCSFPITLPNFYIVSIWKDHKHCLLVFRFLHPQNYLNMNLILSINKFLIFFHNVEKSQVQGWASASLEPSVSDLSWQPTSVETVCSVVLRLELLRTRINASPGMCSPWIVPVGYYSEWSWVPDNRC